jgi:hypothetical protein
LNLNHQLATGNTRATTQRIEIAPPDDAAQLFEATPGPFAIIDLVKLRRDFNASPRSSPKNSAVSRALGWGLL